MSNQSPDSREKPQSERPPGSAVPDRGVAESPGSQATFPQRTQKPGEAGLANESRPGLGSRADDAAPPAASRSPAARKPKDGKPEATPYGYEEPLPEPREQPSDSMAHEQERSTGVSGHSGMN